MEEKKNNKGLVLLTVILIILILGLVGYIIYDKVLSKENTTLNNNVTTTTTTAISTTLKENEKISLNNYPTKNDESVKIYGDIFDIAKKHLNTEDFEKIRGDENNFKNIEFDIENTKFRLYCINYERNFCLEKSLNLDNKIRLNFETFVDYDVVYLIITDKYYIVQYSNGVTKYGSVYIYDKNGNELIKTESTTIYDSKSDEEKHATIFDNKLYFIKHVDCYNTLSYIDLNSPNLDIVELDKESTEGINEC